MSTAKELQKEREIEDQPERKYNACAHEMRCILKIRLLYYTCITNIISVTFYLISLKNTPIYSFVIIMYFVQCSHLLSRLHNLDIFIFFFFFCTIDSYFYTHRIPIHFSCTQIYKQRLHSCYLHSDESIVQNNL